MKHKYDGILLANSYRISNKCDGIIGCWFWQHKCDAIILTVGFDSILAVLLAVKFYSINTMVLLAISFENIYVKV